jgi:hypothetical protein
VAVWRERSAWVFFFLRMRSVWVGYMGGRWGWARGPWGGGQHTGTARAVCHGGCDFGQHSGAPSIRASLLPYLALAHLYVVRHC